MFVRSSLQLPLLSNLIWLILPLDFRFSCFWPVVFLPSCLQCHLLITRVLHIKAWISLQNILTPLVMKLVSNKNVIFITFIFLYFILRLLNFVFAFIIFVILMSRVKYFHDLVIQRCYTNKFALPLCEN